MAQTDPKRVASAYLDKQAGKASPEWWESHRGDHWYVKKERGNDPVYFFPMEAEKDGSITGFTYSDDEAKRNKAKKGKLRKTDFPKWVGLPTRSVPLRARTLIKAKL